MKATFLSILSIFLAIILHAQTASELTNPLTCKPISAKITHAKGGGATVYWSEDFSNGLSGQDDNGQWNTEGDQGELWIQTFPIDQENGYNPNLPIAEYGEVIPNFFDNRDVILSPTRENGVIMLDADRFNSSRTEPDEDFQQHILNNTVDAALISPSINLSENPLVELCFYSYSRVCCDETRYTLVDLSVDGGDNWFILDTVANIQEEYQTRVCLNMSTLLTEVEDVSDCKVRFRWNDFASHYFWFIDDLVIQSIPEHELIASKTWFKPYYSLVSDYENDIITTAEYYNSFEYHTIPDYAIKPIQPAMEVTNAGLAVQTGVTLNFTCTSPSGIVFGPITTDPISIDPFESEILTLDLINFGVENGQIPLELGEYILEYSVWQDEEDEFPENNRE